MLRSERKERRQLKFSTLMSERSDFAMCERSVSRGLVQGCNIVLQRRCIVWPSTQKHHTTKVKHHVGHGLQACGCTEVLVDLAPCPTASAAARGRFEPPMLVAATVASNCGRASGPPPPPRRGWWKRQADRFGHSPPAAEAGQTRVWRIRHCSPRGQYPRRNDWQTGDAGSTLTWRYGHTGAAHVPARK